MGRRGDQEAHRRPLRGRGLPGLAARQGGRPQPGPEARHRRHHHLRLQLRRPRIPAHRHHLLPLHLPRPRPPARLHQERRLQAARCRLRGGLRQPHHRGHLLRHPPDHGEQGDQGLLRPRGREDARPRRARLPRHAAVLRRQHRADRLRRGLPRAAERHRGRPGEPAHHHRGEEVLRGADQHLADRPHRRPPQHTRLRHPLGLALRRGQGDLHRGDAGGRRARHQHHQGARGGAGADLQGQGHHRHRARQADLHRRRAQEPVGGEHGLRPGGLRTRSRRFPRPAPDPPGGARAAPLPFPATEGAP